MTAQIKVKVRRKATIKYKVLPKYPANTVGAKFITITKADGVYTVSVDYTLLDPTTIADPTTASIAVLDATTGSYKVNTLASLLTSGLDADIQAIAALSSTGILVRTASNTWALRTLTAPAAGITITNPAGIAGNPTLVLANDLAALEGLGSTGLAVRSASDTWVQRSLANASAGLTWTNGDGVSGNPTPVFANDLGALEALSGTGLARRTGADAWSVGTTVATAEIADNAVTYAKIQDVTATSRIIGRKTAGSGDPEECTLSDALDFIGSAAQGDILYRGASSWTRLAAGSSGNFLKTQGAGANPTWAAVPGGGDMLAANNLSDVSNAATSRANLGAIKQTLASPVSLTTQTSVTFGSLPSGIKSFIVEFYGISTNGTSNPIIQLGTGGGIETTGYNGSCMIPITSGANVATQHNTGFLVENSINSSTIAGGRIEFSLIDSSTNSWVVSGVIGVANTPNVFISGGYKSLAAVLTQVKITTENGTDQFDAGKVNVIYDEP